MLIFFAENLPNNGVFIWVPSKQLSGDHDYAIEIKSSGPETQNFSALFKIISSGPGIKGTTVVPSTTRAATATYTGSVAVYTGSEASATDDADPSNLNKSAAGSKFAGLSMLVAAAVGMVAGGMLVL